MEETCRSTDSLGHLFATVLDSRRFFEMLPFGPGDVTAGSETELQAAVIGPEDSVDLPLSIQRSNYYQNILKRASRGDTSRRLVSELEDFVHHNREAVWENSWVRFPRRFLSRYADGILERDLLRDKRTPGLGRRADVGEFLYREHGEPFVRAPVSYLLKLSLAECVAETGPSLHPVRCAAREIMEHFISDNTSPETLSFHVVSGGGAGGVGQGVAREMAKRYLLCQLLTQFANRRFALTENGQDVVVFLSPSAPLRQLSLNKGISDAFYRKLFMNPCLSGWDEGEKKLQYMHLCHRVLSRSQLNCLAKLKEAGIITRNLVVLPNTSNTALANNGTHVSIGSKLLTSLREDANSGFTERSEKHMGDLAIKVFEHFLPLFVGTYTATPYRIDFHGFHPERVLGFLPHELDYTHLRMLWRRWKRKAGNRFLGHALQPVGPLWIDRLVSRLLRLRGDYIQDFRLIDYLVSPMSTETSPALNGTVGNTGRLKADLADLGIFDANMSLYSLYRLRDFAGRGFCGFEARHYSLFDSFERDMGEATNLQVLITALAYKLILSRKITHADIPDDPFTESERRQIVFAQAIGVPTAYVRSNSPNRLIQTIVSKTNAKRISGRYSGYQRIVLEEYRRALVRVLKEEGEDLIEAFGLADTVEDLEGRVAKSSSSGAERKLREGILRHAGKSSPLAMDGAEFNGAAERYYRTVLRRRHIAEAMELVGEELLELERSAGAGSAYREVLNCLLGGQTMRRFLLSVAGDIPEVPGSGSEERLLQLIHLVLLSIHHDRHGGGAARRETKGPALESASVL